LSAPLTEAAIQNMRDMIASGALVPGARLPPEAELASLLGASRNTVREAVRALVTARVLDVRRGDGTFVTSLRPELLLEGIGAAVELMQEGFSLELTASAGSWNRRQQLWRPSGSAMTRWSAWVIACSGCATQGQKRSGSSTMQTSMFRSLQRRAMRRLPRCLNAVSSRTIRVRAWRGLMEEGAGARTIAQHQEILDALLARDPGRAEAAALVHVSTTESWFRQAVGEWRPRPVGPR
jgi:GntR family transcriptional repressor for pyruvate dehydrogenase complex